MKKRIIAAGVLALLLTGCGIAEHPTETTAPTEVTQETQEPTIPENSLIAGEEYGLTAFDVAEGCTGILPLGDNYVILTAGGKMLLASGETLAVTGELELGFVLDASDPSIVPDENQLGYYDKVRGAYVTLNRELKEITAIQLDEDMTSTPVVSPDLLKLYYGTAEGIRVLDMTTGTSHLLRQEHRTIISLDKPLFDGSILRYTQMDENGETENCFISTADGGHVSSAYMTGAMATWGEDSFAAVLDLELPMGEVRRIFTGTRTGQLKSLNVGESWDRALIPGDGRVLLQNVAESGLALDWHDAQTGERRIFVCTGRTAIFDRAWLDGENLWLWGTGEKRLYRWNTEQYDAQQESALVTMHTLSQPDEEGLAQAEAQAAALSEKYGVSIQVVEEGNRRTGLDYGGYPDFRGEQYLQALKELDEAMSRFPEGFFASMASREDLRIRLVDDYDPAIGVTEGTGSLELGGGSLVKVSICGNIQEIFYHEMFHAMELEIQNESVKLYDWKSLNPDGMEYAESYLAWEQGRLASSDYLYAVADDYGLVSAREDRAQVFLYAMLDGQEERFESGTMQRKLKLLSSAIRDAFGWNWRSEEFLWEQYLED